MTRDEYEGKTLVLSWTRRFEWRSIIGPGSSAVSTAIADAWSHSGIDHGLPGIQPEDIEFRIETL
jgi:hypothetical protein